MSTPNQKKIRYLKKDFKKDVKFLALYRNGSFEYFEYVDIDKLNTLINESSPSLIRILALTKEAQLYPKPLTENQAYTIKKISIKHIRIN